MKSYICYVDKEILLANLIEIPYQRQLSSVMVNRLITYLKTERKPFLEPIRVNKVPDGLRILDGYNRIKAYKSIDFSIKNIKLEVFENLSVNEEKEVYKFYNLSKKHSTMDLIRPILNELYAVSFLLNNCKINLIKYNNYKKGFNVASFIGYYRQAVKSGKDNLLRGRYDFSIKKNIRKCSYYEYIVNYFDLQDSKRLVKFSEWYVETVGSYNSNSYAYRPIFLVSAIIAYFNTRDLDILTSRMQKFKICAFGRELLKGMPSAEKIKGFYTYFNTKISKGLRKPLFFINF